MKLFSQINKLESKLYNLDKELENCSDTIEGKTIQNELDKTYSKYMKLINYRDSQS